MLFSLFARKYLKTRPDGKLANWQSSIKSLKPLGLKKEFSFLRPYQMQGVSQIHTLHAMGCHALLADEMGLGKTIQSLALWPVPEIRVFRTLWSALHLWFKSGRKKPRTNFPSLKVQILNKENPFKEDSNHSVILGSKLHSTQTP